MGKLPRSFYHRPTLEVAPDLLGKILVRVKQNAITAGKIVEVEAYRNSDDAASHAHRGLTPRNVLMFGEAGHAYVYFIYGMYFCVNVVTEKRGIAGACLIRALEPIEGIETMKKRRPVDGLHDLANGPGKLCLAMAIDKKLNGEDLLGDTLTILDGDEPAKIKRSPRVGIRVATNKRWRFSIDGNPFVSKSKFNK
jgi:DNA-3-methyladenine glycosylase